MDMYTFMTMFLNLFFSGDQVKKKPAIVLFLLAAADAVASICHPIY